MFELLKYLTWCLMPLSLACIFILGCSLWAFAKHFIRLGIALFLTFFWLIGWSLPISQDLTRGSLERKYPPVALGAVPKADAIIILGGGVGSTRGAVCYPEVYSAGDRVIHAARLYLAKKAPLILAAGSNASTAERLILVDLGIPSKAILCDNASRNTEENAEASLKILKERGVKKALLVTSSWHMERALQLFNNSDIKIIPAACDYEAILNAEQSDGKPFWQKLPSPENLRDCSYALKEMLGSAFYSIKNRRK